MFGSDDGGYDAIANVIFSDRMTQKGQPAEVENHERGVGTLDAETVQ